MVQSFSAVSYGVNANVSKGRSVRSGLSAEVVEAPTTQDVILTDIILASYATEAFKFADHAS